MSEIRLVYLTVSSRQEGLNLARLAVGERLAACANLLGQISSVYWWDGQLTEGDEHAVILKTHADLVDRLLDRLRQAHSYDCPAMVVLPVTGGNPPFLDWVVAETIVTP